MFRALGRYNATMSGLENHKTRLLYHGGKGEDRIIKGKLDSLRKALLYSYQAETLVINEEKEFRCLINPDNLKPDYDNKILSIPYEDVCLNSPRIGTTTQGREKIDIKPGDVVKWKETDSYWLIYLQYIEENAYFRADMRRCTEYVEINGNKYWIYLQGPEETTIQWNQKANVSWNDMNYSLFAYITKNEETLDYFHRFTKIKINGKTWQVMAVDQYAADGVIELALKEWFENSIEDENAAEEAPIPETPEPDAVYIEGPAQVYPYSVVEYSIVNKTGGIWSVDNKKINILSSDDTSIKLEIMTGRSGEFNLSYDDVVLNVQILSL